MREKQRKPSLVSVTPLAERLASRIAVRFPRTHFLRTQSERHPSTFVLYVLDGPREEHSVLRLVAEEAADILETTGVHILVEPFSKGQGPDLLLALPAGEQIAIEIKAKRIA